MADIKPKIIPIVKYTMEEDKTSPIPLTVIGTIQSVLGYDLNCKKLKVDEIKQLVDKSTTYNYPKYQSIDLLEADKRIYDATKRATVNVVYVGKNSKIDSGEFKYSFMIPNKIKVKTTSALNPNQMLIMACDDYVKPGYKDENGNVVLINPGLVELLNFENM